MEHQNGWDQNRKLVLNDLESLKCDNQKLFEKMEEIRISLAELRMELRLKSSFWGMLGGGIPSLIVVILYLVFRR